MILGHSEGKRNQNLTQNRNIRASTLDLMLSAHAISIVKSHTRKKES
jgi:hypothetical protein